jgi:hypothetical protein
VRLARAAAARGLAAAAALLPAGARAQEVTFSEAPAPGGAVIGRVCLDRDGDGRCAEGEIGVAGARLLGEGGQVALADGAGRFHLLEVPGRMLLGDRVAYGGHAIAVEGLGVRRAFELGLLGAARVDLAVAPPPLAAPPALAPGGGPGGAPAREPDGRMRWDLAARTAPGAAVHAGAERAVAGADGAVAVPVTLAPGENRLGIVAVSPDGGAAAWEWPVFLAPRRAGGDLVAPSEPVRLAVFHVASRPGGALVSGRVAPGHAVRVGEVRVVPGAGGEFAAFAPEGGAGIELLDDAGRVVATAPLVPERAGAEVRAIAALAEVEVSFFGDPGVLVTARGAGATRVRLGAVELEAGVDLDDRDRDAGLAALLRPRDALTLEHALDPERSLWVTGDDAAADDRNAARGRIWARVEAPGARLELGSARSGLVAGELGRHDRALFGAAGRAEAELGPVRVGASAFGATLREDAGGNAPPAAAHDVLLATGGAALWLSRGGVVPGSEALRVEWRDPVTGRLAEERRLVRGVDYELDWISGRVVLAVPLPSVGGATSLVTAEPFAGVRASVVADYLVAAGGPAEEDLQGGSVAAALGPVSLSVHGANEERPVDPYRLAGAAAALDLGPALRVRAEAARSSGTPFARAGGFARSSDGGWAFGAALAPEEDADALHLEARSVAGPVAVEGWWREREAGYADARFHESLAAEERGAELTVDAGALSGALLVADRGGADPADPSGLAPRDTLHVVARAGIEGERLGLVAEGVYLEQDGTSSGEATSAGARARWRVDRSLTLDVSHHQALRTEGDVTDPTFTAAGASLTHGATTVSARGGWGPDLGARVLVSGARAAAGDAVYGTFTADPDAPDVVGGRAAGSALGARRAAGGAEAWSEENLVRDAFGLRTARVFGLALARAGFRASLSGEEGERLRLDGTRAERTGAAAAVSLVRGALRASARGELRREGADDVAGAGASVEWSVARWGVSARASWLEGTVDGREALGLDATLAGALRREPLSFLASLSRIADRRPGEARRDAVVARLAATADVRRVELGVGAGLALQEVLGGRDDRLAGSARARVRLVGPLDGALEYARRAPLRGGDLGALDAVRVEAGVSKRESRIAVGYTLVGFGGDGLAPASDTGRLYVRAQLSY